MKGSMSALFFAVALASAQTLEIGAKAGYGTFGAEDVSARAFGNGGVEVCGWCSGRFAAFGEYSRWALAEEKLATSIESSDLVAGGLRIQGGSRLRPFFDVGLAVGECRFLRYTGDRASHGIGGLVLGGGVGIRLGRRLYIRPQYRLYMLSGLHVATGGAVGVGFRF